MQISDNHLSPFIKNNSKLFCFLLHSIYDVYLKHDWEKAMFYFQHYLLFIVFEHKWISKENGKKHRFIILNTTLFPQLSCNSITVSLQVKHRITFSMKPVSLTQQLVTKVVGTNN